MWHPPSIHQTLYPTAFLRTLPYVTRSFQRCEQLTTNEDHRKLHLYHDDLPYLQCSTCEGVPEHHTILSLGYLLQPWVAINGFPYHCQKTVTKMCCNIELVGQGFNNCKWELFRHDGFEEYGCTRTDEEILGWFSKFRKTFWLCELWYLFIFCCDLNGINDIKPKWYRCVMRYDLLNHWNQLIVWAMVPNYILLRFKWHKWCDLYSKPKCCRCVVWSDFIIYLQPISCAILVYLSFDGTLFPIANLSTT